MPGQQALTLYFAAPLFCRGELETLGFRVFLPQRDGFEISRPSFADLTDEERALGIFSQDSEVVRNCQIRLFVLEGRVSDEGSCAEFGIAFEIRTRTGCRRHILGLETQPAAALGTITPSDAGRMLRPDLPRCGRTSRFLQGGPCRHTDPVD